MVTLDPTAGQIPLTTAQVENPRLLKAMHEVALDDTPEKRRTVYAELLAAVLLVPTPETTFPPGAHVADGTMSFQIIGIKDASGKDVTPAFTDDEALRNWDSKTASVGLRAADYFKMVASIPAFQEIVINPFVAGRKMIRPGGRVTRREFESLAKGVLPDPKPALQTINAAAGTEMRFKKLENRFPDSAMQQIREILARFEEAQSAFLLKVAYGQEKPHSAIAVHFSISLPQEKQRLLAKLVLETVRSLLAKGEVFDMIPMSGSLYKDVSRTVQSFYQRALN